ncbi:MAG: class B sortase [Oscillospiraceae bacterium]|nr:class B sortase [Oscillospiraceae bacterium]
MSMMNELTGVTRKKEENFFVRVLKYFLPWKGDDFGEILRKIVFVGSIVFFCMSLQAVIDYYKVDAKEIERHDEIVQLAPDFSDEGSSIEDMEWEWEVEYNGPVAEDNPDVNMPQANQNKDNTTVYEQWNGLLKQNKDTMGWVKIPTYIDENGEQYINYPVMYTKEIHELSGGKFEDFYLHHNFDKRWTESGALYIDKRCYVNSALDRSDVITIYGHHMKRLGNMFTRLAEYKSGVDFLKHNPIISFDTLYTKNQKYIIIGCYISNIEENQDNGVLFDYWRYRDFDEEHTFENFISEINKRSWYHSDIKCTEDDEYITLSTCSNEAGQSKLRWVITARKLKASDDVDALIDSYRDNKDIYFPRNWINAKGNKKVYDGWWY